MTGFLIEHKLLPKSPVGIFMKMTNNIDNKESALRIHDWRLAVRDILGPGYTDRGLGSGLLSSL